MRITFKTVNRHMQYVINDRYNDMAKLQEQLSTGKRLLRPSDGPVDVANVLKLSTKVKENEQFKKNIDDGLAFMGVSGTAMNDMNTLMQRLRELTLQGSTDTIGAKERLYINKEVEQLTKQVLALINTKYKGDYVFSGSQSKIPPFVLVNSAASTDQDYTDLKMSYYNAAGQTTGVPIQLYSGSDEAIEKIIPGTFKLKMYDPATSSMREYVEGTDYTMNYGTGEITFLNAALLIDVTPSTPPGTAGNYMRNQVAITFEHVAPGKDILGRSVASAGDIYREIETGITMPINVTADELLNDNTTGTDMIGALIALGQALVQDDQPNVESSIDRLDIVMKTLLGAESKNGARINRFETTLERNEIQNTQITELRANLEDADMAETITKFSTLQNVYNAALKSAATVIQPSLVNFL